MADARRGEGGVVHNEDAGRYEMEVAGGVAIAEYVEEAGVVRFTHTEVPPAEQGRGVGSALVRGALDDVRARGLQAVPLCPFVAAFVRRHPEYAELVRQDG
jgi:uncharacterized protein